MHLITVHYQAKPDFNQSLSPLEKVFSPFGKEKTQRTLISRLKAIKELHLKKKKKKKKKKNRLNTRNAMYCRDQRA